MVYAGPPTRTTHLRRIAVLLGLFVLLQFLTVLNPDIVEVDPEEGYNAAHGLALAQGHWRSLFDLQYRPFCGGCTLNAVVAAPLFWVLQPAWWVWKLVPISYSALLLAVGLWRLPTPSRWIFAGLFVLPLHSWMTLSLVGWGNHYEAGCLAATGLLLLHAPRRPTWAGVALGAATWVGFSGLFAIPAATMWLMWQSPRDLWRLLCGLCVGLSPWLAQWLLAASTPFGEVYGQGEAIPSLSHIPTQLMTLLHPRQLGGLLGHPWLPMLGVPVAITGVIGLLGATRTVWGRLVILAAGCWLGIYALSGFHIPIPPPPTLPEPASVRYMAPLLPLLMLGLAITGGALWENRRHRAVVALLTPAIVAGLLSRASVFSSPFPTAQALTMSAADMRLFRMQSTASMDRSTHRSCPGTDAREQRMHGFALGHRQASVALQGNPTPSHALMGFRTPSGVHEAGFHAGAAVALIDHMDPDGSGSIDRLMDAISIAERWGEPAVHALLRSRRYASWLSTIDGHDAQALMNTATLLTDRHDALWWLVGLRWGEDSSRPLVFGEMVLPDLTAEQQRGITAQFAAGLGEALGEQWGPREPPYPQQLPSQWTEAFANGYQTGTHHRWPASLP